MLVNVCFVQSSILARPNFLRHCATTGIPMFRQNYFFCQNYLFFYGHWSCRNQSSQNMGRRRCTLYRPWSFNFLNLLRLDCLLIGSYTRACLFCSKFSFCQELCTLGGSGSVGRVGLPEAAKAFAVRLDLRAVSNTAPGTTCTFHFLTFTDAAVSHTL